jgi:hypothetical protein
MKEYTFDEILFGSFSPIDEEEVFDEYLNEVYSFSLVGGPFSNLDPAEVLKEVDPMQYDISKNEFLNEEYTEYKGEYWKTEDFQEAEEMYEEQEEINEDDEDE